MGIIKINLLNIRLVVAIIMIGMTGLCFRANGQTEKERTRIKLYFSKLPDGVKKITAGLIAGKGKDMHPVANVEIQFTASAGDSTVVLASIPTDGDGMSILNIESGYVFPTDDEGKTLIEASYKGNDQYRKSSNDVEVADLSFEISFETEDSIKYIYVSAHQVMPDGEKIPVEELDITIGVTRLFSILPIGEIETDENGVAKLEFPNDIPGDSIGAVTAVARIEDHDDYGTVAQQGKINWGIPVSYALKPLPRKLWTDEAPLWMIFSVFIILTGAWYHFFLSIYKLNKIRKIKEEYA